jgi:hypothetical protein
MRLNERVGRLLMVEDWAEVCLVVSVLLIWEQLLGMCTRLRSFLNK